MERIEAKKINGKVYYYYSKWGWVNGKCRRQWQRYLGKLEDIARVIECGHEVQHAEVFDFGLPASLWLEAERQETVQHIDRLCPKRRQGLSIGEYISIASVNRAVRPVSKLAIWDWFSRTVLCRKLPGATQASLTSQRFWDHMDAIPAEAIPEIWREIIADTVAREKIDLSRVCYDGTNFYTFINTFNTRSSMARRGKNKQGRGDLRQVGYALFCSRDGNVPLYYDVYEGNRNDARQFPAMIRRFHEFLRELAGDASGPPPETTVVFDKGNNSADNVELLDRLKLHFIGTVKLDEHKELADLPTDSADFLPCRKSSLDGVKALRTEKIVYGKRRTVIVTFNERLFEGQRKTIDTDIDKATTGLAELKKKLDERVKGVVRKGRAPSPASVKKQCDQLLKRPFMKQIVQVRIDPGSQLEYRIDSARLKELADSRLGKKIIITSRHEWDTEDIIEGYHNQYVIEHVFGEMKERERGVWWPMNHWTDHKICVHGLYCTIAVLLRALVLRRIRDRGLDLSMDRLWRELGEIREVVNVFKRGRRRKNIPQQTVLTKLDETQGKIVDILQLKRAMKEF